MKRVTIELGYPVNAHVTAAAGWSDFVRHWRTSRDVAEELRAAGYDVVIERQEARA